MGNGSFGSGSDVECSGEAVAKSGSVGAAEVGSGKMPVVTRL